MGVGQQPLPLSDVRIMDLTAFWAGPVATAVLAALGADVMKVEGVRRPDGMRFANGRPPSWDQWWEWGPVYLCSNTNKHAVSLELTHPRGRETALEMISHCDLVIENFSPRVMAHFGLEWDVVRGANPAVSMVRMPAFGLDGPWRDRVGFAQTMEQASGMAWMTGPADGPPVVPRGPCDPIAGLHAAFSAIAALEVRDRTGEGIHVEAAMVEAAINIAAEAVVEASRDGITPSRDGNRGPGSCPQGVFPCAEADSWVAIAVLRDEDWPAFATAIGQPGLAADTSLRGEFSRRAVADEIDEAIRCWTSERTAAQVVHDLRRVGIGAARVVAPADLLSDEQLEAVGFWEVVEHPVAGRFKTTGMPFTFAGRSRNWIRTPAPTYGEHTGSVLIGLLGKSAAEVDQLLADGVIRDRPAGL
jgi:crotonobetainyl-CoA:carnitine CoA-transferase CaiB-like acyl-CoA transferase